MKARFARWGRSRRSSTRTTPLCGSSSKVARTWSWWMPLSRENGAELASELPTLLSYTPRERARAFVRAAFPKRKWKIIAVRDAMEFRNTIRRTLIDAALVDIGSPVAATSSGGEAIGILGAQAAAAQSADM